MTDPEAPEEPGLPPDETRQDDMGCEAIPAGLVELHEVMEWQAAARARAAEAAE